MSLRSCQGISPGASPSTHFKSKLTLEHKKAIASFVDSQHRKGKAVVSRYVLAFLLERFDLVVHRTTIGRTMKNMGLGWLPVRQAKRTFASYRIKAIRDYLIAFDSHLRHQSSRRSQTVFVFTDESYVNMNHCLKNSYFPHFSISDSTPHDSKLEFHRDSNLESLPTKSTG